MGAGLGGGSSNAASTLMAINTIFKLELENAELAEMAKQLGADCPFFIYNKAVNATGIGTQFTDVELDLTGYHIVLIKPNLHISTAEAYAGVKLEEEDDNLNLSVLRNIDLWHGHFPNSFEKHLFLRYPILNDLKESLYQQGATYASMSGSGSSIYGIFKSKPEILPKWENHFLWTKKL
jgi:4-diphosphocytidyl-2-C-methyl-D-erythritol kinase